MTLDPKALRALYDAYVKADDAQHAAAEGGMDMDGPAYDDLSRAVDRAANSVNYALLNAAPDLLTLAEAVRDLAPAIRTLAHPTSDHPHAAAARRVLAILGTPPRAAGDGR